MISGSEPGKDHIKYKKNNSGAAFKISPTNPMFLVLP